jgi:hypothetical protein
MLAKHEVARAVVGYEMRLLMLHAGYESKLPTSCDKEHPLVAMLGDIKGHTDA